MRQENRPTPPLVLHFGLEWGSYYELARACGINMMESRIFSENGRNHFMTRRFDRESKGRKKFVQTFAALAHYDYFNTGHYSCEQLFMLMKKLDLPKEDFEEQFRRIVFNLVGCNQDDHVKNFSFLMDRDGNWSLSPAYDLCHAEGSGFTQTHQLRLCGKVSGFTRGDLKELASYAGLKRGQEARLLDRTISAFRSWRDLADELEVPEPIQDHVSRTLRLEW